jgi:hypothetical protein
MRHDFLRVLRLLLQDLPLAFCEEAPYGVVDDTTKDFAQASLKGKHYHDALARSNCAGRDVQTCIPTASFSEAGYWLAPQLRRHR